MSRVPVWLLLGPEAGLKADFIDTLKKSCRERGDVEESRHYAHEKDVSDLVSDLQSGSLFGALQFVSYIGVDLVKGKADLAPLVAYCKNPSQDAVLCLIGDSTQVDASLKAVIPQDAQKTFWEMFEDRKSDWVRGFFRKEGIGIDDEAVETILELVENNTAALRDECSRLAFFLRSRGTISGPDVAAYIAHNREEDAFSLFDRMLSGDVEAAFGTLAKILFSKESDSVGLLAGIAWSFRRLSEFLSLRTQFPEDQAFLRSGIKSKTMQANYRKAARVWPEADCERVLALCADTDAAIRSSGSALSRIYLETFVYSAMKKGGRPLEKDDHGRF